MQHITNKLSLFYFTLISIELTISLVKIKADDIVNPRLISVRDPDEPITCYSMHFPMFLESQF